VSVERFLKQRAVTIAVDGTYTLPNWYDCEGKLRTFACRTTRVSPFRMIVDVPVVGKVGDRLSSYFRDFGKFDGLISDTMDGSFLLELEMTREMRERMAGKLVWLEKKQADPKIFDNRQHARFIPPGNHTTVTLADGAIHRCFIIDLSQTSAGRHTVGDRRLRRPGGTRLPQWLCGKIHRNAAARRSRPPGVAQRRAGAGHAHR
jgi:hypothetical protein